MPYFNPHSFRKTLVGVGQAGCQTPEEFKAWSQNMGHDLVMTTLCSYGTVQPQRQAELIQKLGMPRDTTIPNMNAAELAKAVVYEMEKRAVE